MVLYHSKRTIIVREADLSKFFFFSYQSSCFLTFHKFFFFLVVVYFFLKVRTTFLMSSRRLLQKIIGIVNVFVDFVASVTTIIVFCFFILSSAIVFNCRCFLRGRCAMEMWCPYDTGRESWVWVGPLAGGRARFNSPEWGGGLLAEDTGTSQNVLLLLLFFFVHDVLWHSGSQS